MTKFVEYAIQDTVVVYDIITKCNTINDAIAEAEMLNESIRTVFIKSRPSIITEYSCMQGVKEHSKLLPYKGAKYDKNKKKLYQGGANYHNLSGYTFSELKAFDFSSAFTSVLGSYNIGPDTFIGYIKRSDITE